MKVLVTGSNGLLGQKLVSLLSARPDTDLIATGRGVNRNPTGNYTYQTLDVTNAHEVQSVIGNHRPDVVIHTAAMTQVDDCEVQKEQCRLINISAVEYLVHSTKDVDGFFIHLSTDFVFDGKSGPYREEDSPNPLSYYAESKLASEQIVSESGVRGAIARTMLVYGVAHDMSRSNIILWVKKSLEEKHPIKVVNDQWRMPTLAEDLARGCLLLADKQVEGIFHLSGKDMLTPYEMAIQTAGFFGLDKSLIEEVDGSTFTQTARRPARTGFVLDKARRLLGYDPVSFTEGLGILASQLVK